MGIVRSVVAAMVSIAATQPNPLIMACNNGAKINCPNEPPALMKPPAKARRSIGSCRDVAPIKVEKLPAPAPAAVKTPIVKISDHSEFTMVVKANPPARMKAPITRTPYEPFLSAIAPNIGWANPQINCPIARAKLMLTILNPVDELIGKTKSPADCLAPIVIARIAAELNISIQGERVDFISVINSFN
ncbi:hypothetical protein UNSWDHB_1802 [Dehalobacter sp. UNSWDHB]|nr:hypothetical protein DHBDCA_p1204 [Dehalobacter sp. DCA]AFV05275.1 hypothetical protein DCF50_p1269 [Dehalobacter sp. CF]EQB20869.1 hypothetical protein UNSWDHB_1802 [Dehalobacter sp. UNSWDHB]